MQKDRKKINGKKIRFIFGAMFVCFLALLSLVYYIQYYQLSKELGTANEEFKRIEAANRELEEEVSRLQEDEYIEFLARRHLGLARPEGESRTTDDE